MIDLDVPDTVAEIVGNQDLRTLQRRLASSGILLDLVDYC